MASMILDDHQIFFQFKNIFVHHLIIRQGTTSLLCSDILREVLLVDSSKDQRLSSIIVRATEMINNFADLESQARVLALFVANCFGGDSPTVSSIAEVTLIPLVLNISGSYSVKTMQTVKCNSTR